jgi:sterol 3beta-glucosyltransferase
MMICHGGAGVVNACLRAGIPSLVVPVMGDQFAWAALVHTLGYGRQVCRRYDELKPQHLIEGIAWVQQSAAVQTNCRRVEQEIGQQNGQETGPKALVTLMEQKCNDCTTTQQSL